MQAVVAGHSPSSSTSLCHNTIRCFELLKTQLLRVKVKKEQYNIPSRYVRMVISAFTGLILQCSGTIMIIVLCYFHNCNQEFPCIFLFVS